MKIAIELLKAYAPQGICAKCLAAIMAGDETETAQALSSLVLAGEAEATYGECLNCAVARLVFRSKASP